MKAGAAAFLLLLLSAGRAGAHPVDEVVQGAYLTLAPGEVRLELDLTPGTMVAAALLRDMDPNRDQRISDAEARAYAAHVLQQSTLMLDGTAAAWRLDKVSVPPYQNVLLATDTLKIYAVAARTERAGAHTLRYDNGYQPAKSQCIANIFLQPGAGWRYQVAGQRHSDDGRQLAVDYTGARP